MIRSLARRILPWLALPALLAGAPGCFNPFDPLVSARRGISEPPPVPIDPPSTLRLFKWCWENRSIEEYRELFTDDYIFVFAETDSAGNAFRDVPWTREDEMISTSSLFGGGGTEPPADRITLDFTRTLTTFGSTFPGHNPHWHKTIRAEVYLRVQRGQSTLEVRGPGLFYFVRGDSAALPDELVQRGFRPDSTRWYIERWEDETVSSGGAAFGARPATAAAVEGGTGVQPYDPPPLPPSIRTWGGIKEYFRGASRP